MSNSWKKLVHQLNQLQNKFKLTVDGLEKSKREKSGVCGHWNPKQVVAHMTGWEIETILQFKRVENGHTAIEHDIDLFNEKSVYQRHHLNWDETIHELKEAQKQFNQKILSISVNDPSKNEAYRELMDVQIEHYKHHTHQIEGWL